MSYRGDTYRIACGEGGFAYRPPDALLNPNTMVGDTRNLNLYPNGRRKRGGSAIIGTTSTGDRITGLFNYRRKCGTQYIVMADDVGALWRDPANAITPSAGAFRAGQHFHMSTFRTQGITGQNKLYIVGPGNAPHVWDGNGLAAPISNLPTDWNGVGGNVNYPRFMVTHGRGASLRRWAGGGELDPYVLYVSALNDAEDFSDANVVLVRVDTKDAFGVVAVAEYGDRLFAFGRETPFIVNDESTDTSYWGAVPGSWKGGVYSQRLVVETPANDIVCMTGDGEIYSVVAAMQYGDYQTASLTQASGMDEWIREHVELTLIDKFHAVYDRTLKAIKFFVVRKGHTEPNTALVYFIYRKPEQAWMIHDNRLKDGTENTASGYKCSASAPVEIAPGRHAIYTGDMSGRLWRLETQKRADDGNAYYGGWTTPRLDFENPRTEKDIKKIEIEAELLGDYDIEVALTVDDFALAGKTVNLKPTAGFLLDDSSLGLLSTASLKDQPDIAMKECDVGAQGRVLEMTLYNDTAGEDFFVSQVLLDEKTQGKLPK